jgi:hypothetical protein
MVHYLTVKCYKTTQLLSGMLQNSTAIKRNITKRYTDIIVCYITVHYGHNQLGSSNPTQFRLVYAKCPAIHWLVEFS